MEALLGGLRTGGFGADASRGLGSGCNSIDDLRAQLHDSVASRRTETRAEHVSETFLLRAGAVVTINEEQPSAPDADDDPEQPREVRTRSVNITETIQNQPADNPALQGAVAKHVAGVIGQVDDSVWTVREVSKTAQGWTFTYLCKHSLQSWNRQNAKKPGRPPIGAFSGSGGQDPVNISRPAFDCRGTLTIAYSKSSRALVIKYAHTPLHQTVAQLLERLEPTIPPPPVPNLNQGVANKSTKAKRPPPAAGEESARKKRKKQGESANESQLGNGSQEQPDQLDQPPAAAPAPANPLLNVPPAEAARRSEVALGLLTGRGIDPATLSPEQFIIFSNQAPHLQDVSLDMIAKYGAERLRIVQPDDRDQPTSTSTAPSQQVAPANDANGTMTAVDDSPFQREGLGGDSGAPTTASDVAQEGGPVAVEATPAEHSTGTPRHKRTRGACDTCKKNKRKCTKQHPQCSVCVELGETCVYLPPIPRKKSILPAPVTSANDSEADLGVEQGAIPPAEQEVQQAQSAEQHVEQQTEQQIGYAHPAPQPVIHTTETVSTAAAPDNDDEFIPDPNILSGPIETALPAAPAAPPIYYENHVSSGTFTAHNSRAASDSRPLSPGLDFPRIQRKDNAHQPTPDSTFPDPAPIHEAQQPRAVSFPPPTTLTEPYRQPVLGGNNRRNLPTAPSSQVQGAAPSTIPIPPPVLWGSMSAASANTSTRPTPAATPSPTIAYQPARRPRSRRSGAEPTSHNTTSTVQTAAAPPISSPPATRSPFQNQAQKPDGRASSRQGHRAQSQAPTTQTPVPPPQIPHSYNSTPAAPYSHQASTTSADAIPPYDPFGRLGDPSGEQYSQAGGGQSSRIAYEPHSYKHSTTTYSTAAYSYSRGGGSGNALSQALTSSSDFAGTSSGNTNTWEGSQDRASRFNVASSNTADDHYSAAHNSQTNSRSYRPTRATHRQEARPDTTYNQPHQQPQQSQHSYNSYPSQQPDINQQQSTNWYGFASNSHTNAAAAAGEGTGTGTRGAGYSSGAAAANAGYNQGQRSAAPGYHGYGGDHDIYELLRTGNSH